MRRVFLCETGLINDGLFVQVILYIERLRANPQSFLKNKIKNGCEHGYNLYDSSDCAVINVERTQSFIYNFALKY